MDIEKRLRDDGARIGKIDPPVDLVDRLRLALDTAKPQPASRRWLRPGVALTMAATICFLILSGIHLLDDGKIADNQRSEQVEPMDSPHAESDPWIDEESNSDPEETKDNALPGDQDRKTPISGERGNPWLVFHRLF